jgi:N-methylhydantoinase A
MAKRGVDPRDFALFAYGGAGPTHAFLLAREVGVKRVVVPRAPGTLCALGSLVTEIKSDFIKTLYDDLGRYSLAQLDQEFRALETSAREWLTAQHVTTVEHYTLRSADMRYKGQSFDITVPLTDAFSAAADLEAIRAPFHLTYERIYGFSDPAAPVEIINARVTIVGVTPKPVASPLSKTGGQAERAEPSDRREILENRRPVTAAIYQWDDLAVGQHFAGPAVVEAADTTVFIPTGFQATLDRWGTIVAEDA